MTRCAILVGSPFIEGQKGYLPGVTPDITNMNEHLRSLNGGAWKSSEIKILTNPSRSELISACSISVDFVLFQYSGHGFEYNSSGTQIDINPNENISLREIHKAISAKHRIYLLDCCRKVEKIVEKSMNFSMESLRESVAIRNAYRKKYEDIIDTCEEGIVLIHSCDKNQAAAEDEKGRGGIFTYSLFNSVNDLQTLEEIEYYSINTCFDLALKKMDQDYLYNTQLPQINTERRNNEYPFVI